MSGRRTAPAPQARARRGARGAPAGTRPLPALSLRSHSRRHPLRKRDSEDPELVDGLLALAEAGRLHQLIHLTLGAPAHDPGLALAVAGERPRDQFKLRMPGLAGIDEVAAGRDRNRQASKRALNQGVVRKQLVEARNYAERRLRLHCREAVAVEGIGLHEARNVPEPLLGDELRATLHVEVAVVAQQDRIGLHLGAFERLQHVAAVAGGDVHHPYRSSVVAQQPHGHAKQLLNIELALTDAAPADRLKIVAIDETADRPLTARLVAVDVVERRT